MNFGFGGKKGSNCANTSVKSRILVVRYQMVLDHVPKSSGVYRAPSKTPDKITLGFGSRRAAVDTGMPDSNTVPQLAFMLLQLH